MPSSIDSASVLAGGREAEGDVLQHLDEDAAEAEGDELAEAGVGDRADDDLLAAGWQHLLHLHAVDLGVGFVALGVGDDGLVALARPRSAVFTPTSTPPASVLCRMSGETIFSTTGKPMPSASLAASSRRVREAFLRHRDAVGVADQLALGRRQSGSPDAFTASRTLRTVSLSLI